MKILFLSFSKIGSIAANAVQQSEMFNAFASTSHRVTGLFMCFLSNMNETFKNNSTTKAIIPIPVTPITRLSLHLYSLVIYIAGKLGNWDLAYTRSPVFAATALGAGLHTILELHAVPEQNMRDDRNVLKLWSHQRIARIVTISQTLADDLVDRYGLPHSGCDILVAHDGANAGPRPGAAAEHDGPLRVGYFGHLYPGKGMEMIATLAPIVPELHFDVYGGTEADLDRWRRACAGQDNLTLHGHIPHAQVSARMIDCDILIAPYGAKVSHAGKGDIGRWMSPLKLFEYMAAERPVVASDMPVLREVVRDGETALLCCPGDAPAFAAALRCLACDRELRSRLGSAGRDLLEAEYTWKKRAERILEGIVTEKS